MIGSLWPWQFGVAPKTASGVNLAGSAILVAVMTPARSVKMNPALGGGLESIVFETSGTLLKQLVESEIRRVVADEVPEVQSLAVNVEDAGDGQVDVDVAYSVDAKVGTLSLGKKGP